MRRFSIRNKAILFGLILSVSFCVMASTVLYIYLINNLTKDRVASMQEIAIEQIHETSANFGRYKLVIKLFGEHTSVLNYLQDQSEIQRTELDDMFSKYVNSDPNVLSLYLINKDGNTLVSTDKSFVNQNYGFREYFKSAMTGKPFVEAAFGKTSKKFGYYFSYPIFSENNTVEGVLVIKINNTFIDQPILDSEIGKDSLLMLVDDHGIVMVSGDQKRFLSSLGTMTEDDMKELDKENKFLGEKINSLQYDILQNAISNYTTPQTYRIFDKTDNDNETVYVHKIDDLPFYFVIETRFEKIQTEVLRVALIMVAVNLSIILLLLLIGFSLISRFFLQPILKLIKVTDIISAGDFSHTVDIKTNDELEDLAGSFNTMVKKLEKSSLILKDYAKSLEDKVLEKTVDLQKKVLDLDNTRKAVLNVAEDAEKFAKDVEDKSRKLELDKMLDEALLANIGDGIVAADQDGIVTMVNDAALDMLGYSRKEFVGKAVIDVLIMVDEKGDRVNMSDRPMVLALSTGQKSVTAVQKSHYYVRKDGQKFPVSLTATPFVLNKKIVGAVEVFRDVTLEKDIDKMKNEFVSVASHQLRTPLTAIKLFTEMLANNEVGVLEPKQQEYVNDIHESTDRMVKLVNDLLNVARLETGRLKIEPKPVQLEKVLTNIIDEFEIVSKAKNAEVKFDKPNNLLPLMALDETLIRQVFHNLVGNSIKYAKPGAVRVDVKLTTTELSPETTGLISKRFDGPVVPSVVVSVTDNGIGIPEAVQKRIFEKFFRADNALKSAAEGTGLGLYICRMIVEASDGHIWFESTSKGTTFYVTIPLKGMVARQGEKGLA